MVTFATTHAQLRLLQYMHSYICCNTYMITFAATCTSLRLLQHVHSYVCCNIYTVTFIAIHTQLRLLQHIHDYVCCNTYTTIFVTANTRLCLLQYIHNYVCYNTYMFTFAATTRNVRNIVHSDNATHQSLTEFIVHIQPEPILISIHPSESTEHKLPRPVLLGHTKADYIYIFAYIYHFSIITSSILA